MRSRSWQGCSPAGPLRAIFAWCRAFPGRGRPLHLPWLLWAAAFGLADGWVVHVQVRRDSHSFSLTDLVLAAALCLASPVGAVRSAFRSETAELVLLGIGRMPRRSLA